ncbi:MAG: hypothetical protein DMF84_02170 [Acidobacteria bacterium]|nr:MAG: hypothetical protein DMF84_02170 [Acidobacteriota bacterium]
MEYVYAADILDPLAAHGLRPTATTPPGVVRDALSDLYRYEIRRLRRTLLEGGIQKPDYADHVIALRKRYWLLSLPVRHWAATATEEYRKAQ